MSVTETAYAKINLALHIRARRADGYHDIETLFAFVDQGDILNVAPAQRDHVCTLGEFGGHLTNPFDNIAMQALGVLPRSQGLGITLEKNLPVAAGLGGGSADAGAIFRIIRAMQGLPQDWQERAAKLGADVPACVESVSCIGRGTGTLLEPVESDLTGTAVLLVNPRIALPTGTVFAAWDGHDRGPMPCGNVSDIAGQGRNDLEKLALALCPHIGTVLDQLRQTSTILARMSGSGATCFALYESDAAMREAAEAVSSAHPDWWQMQGRLR